VRDLQKKKKHGGGKKREIENTRRRRRELLDESEMGAKNKGNAHSEEIRRFDLSLVRKV